MWRPESGAIRAAAPRSVPGAFGSARACGAQRESGSGVGVPFCIGPRCPDLVGAHACGCAAAEPVARVLQAARGRCPEA
eukprot:1779487-Prymnesium_polylepis.1